MQQIDIHPPADLGRPRLDARGIAPQAKRGAIPVRVAVMAYKLNNFMT